MPKDAPTWVGGAGRTSLLSQQLPFDRVLAKFDPLLCLALDEHLDFHVNKLSMLQHVEPRLLTRIAETGLHREWLRCRTGFKSLATDGTQIRATPFLHLTRARAGCQVRRRHFRHRFRLSRVGNDASPEDSVELQRPDRLVRIVGETE